eukprot:GEMP01017040.1.p1 GENE.GEMP01017040.1~~GEMP01017040.1.p1  ORF type:complete len:654 (+),score=102.73 GEMP01017040.1:55-2016(+)
MGMSSFVKRRARALLRRLSGGQSILSDFGSMLYSFIGTFCPCIQGIRSAKYQSLSEDVNATDKTQAAADRVGSILMFVSLFSFIMLMLKFSVGIRIERMDDYNRNLPLILYATILEILICGASMRTVALMYRRRRHVKKHPNDLRNAEYVKVGPISRADLNTPWGFAYRPSMDGIEALLVEDVYKSSLVADWNEAFATKTTKTANETTKSVTNGETREVRKMSEDKKSADDEMNEVNEMENFESKADVEREQQKTANELIDINLSMGPGVTDDNESADEMPPIEMAILSYGLAIVGVNEIHGDVGPMQVELMTAQNVTLYCHTHLGDPTMEDEELKEAFKAYPGATVIGNKDDANATLPASTHTVSVVGLEDEEPQMLLRWVLCSFTLGWVSLLPVVFLEPHEERPRQTQFQNIFGTAGKIILPIWIVMWIVDSVSIMLHIQLIPPFFYYIIVHMVLAGIVVILGMKLQFQDTEHVCDQRRVRRDEVEAAGDAENNVKIRPFVTEDPPPTLLRELLICNPIAVVFMGCLVAIPIVIGTLFYPLNTERGKLAQTYVCMTFGSLCILQLATIGLLWQLTLDIVPTVYLAGFAALVWYPCFIAYCICLLCSGHYAKRDLDLCRRQRIERAAAYVTDKNAVEIGETRGREWELSFSI